MFLRLHEQQRGKSWPDIKGRDVHSLTRSQCHSKLLKSERRMCSVFVVVWGSEMYTAMYQYIYIYIYAFSRRFYPKRLTIAFRLYIFISTCVPWESNPQPFAQQTQCSTTEPHRNTVVPRMMSGHNRYWMYLIYSPECFSTLTQILFLCLFLFLLYSVLKYGKKINSCLARETYMQWL